MSERLERIEKMLTFGWIEPDARSVMREILDLVGEQATAVDALTARVDELESRGQRAAEYAAARVGK